MKYGFTIQNIRSDFFSSNNHTHFEIAVVVIHCREI